MTRKVTPAERAAAAQAIRQFAADVAAVDDRRRRARSERAAATTPAEGSLADQFVPSRSDLPALTPFGHHIRCASPADLEVAMNAVEKYVWCHSSLHATGLLKILASKVGRAALQRRSGERIDPTWQQVEDFYATWRDKHDGSEFGARTKAADAFDVDVRTIDARRREAKKALAR